MQTMPGAKEKTPKAAKKNGLAPRQREEVLLQTPEHGFLVERDEMARVMVQSLREMGFPESARCLERESGVTDETADVESAEALVLAAKWSEAGELLQKTLAEVDRNKSQSERVAHACKVLLAQEQYHERLLRGDLAEALVCLQQDLAPLCGREETSKHASLLLCEDEASLRRKIRRHGASEADHRRRVWERLRALLPTSIAMPRQRLLTLVDNALVTQVQRYSRDYSPARVGRSGLRLPVSRDVTALADELNRLPSRLVQRVSVKTGGESVQIWCVAFNGAGTRVACAGTDRHVRIYDLATKEGSVSPELRPAAVFENAKVVTCLAWSPCGDFLAFGDEEGSVLVFDGLDAPVPATVSTAALVLRNFRKRVVRVCWVQSSRGSEKLLAGSLDSTLIMFDARTGDMLGHCTGSPIYDFVYSPMRKLVVAACGGLSHKREHRPQQRFLRVLSVDFRPGGRDGPENEAPAAPAVDSGQAHFTDLSDECKEGCFDADGPIVSLALSRDEQVLLATLMDGRLIEWSMRTGLRRACFEGAHLGCAVIRSSLGGFCEGLVATGTAEGCICFWERRDAAKLAQETTKPVAVSIKPALTLCEHTQPVNAVAWSPVDPSTFVSVSDDGTMLLWSCDPDSDAMTCQ